MNSTYERLIKIIYSCITEDQVITCYSLIDLFKSKYAREKTGYMYMRGLYKEAREKKKEIKQSKLITQS